MDIANEDTAFDLPRTFEECYKCAEFFPTNKLFVAPCKHKHCDKCVSSYFSKAMEDHKAPSCCQRMIAFQHARHHLQFELEERYRHNKDEWETPEDQRTYCSRKACLAFIAPPTENSSHVTCRKCDTQTCTSCKNRRHDGACLNDSGKRQSSPPFPNVTPDAHDLSQHNPATTATTSPHPLTTVQRAQADSTTNTDETTARSAPSADFLRAYQLPEHQSQGRPPSRQSRRGSSQGKQSKRGGGRGRGSGIATNRATHNATGMHTTLEMTRPMDSRRYKHIAPKPPTPVEPPADPAYLDHGQRFQNHPPPFRPGMMEGYPNYSHDPQYLIPSSLAAPTDAYFPTHQHVPQHNNGWDGQGGPTPGSFQYDNLQQAVSLQYNNLQPPVSLQYNNLQPQATPPTQWRGIHGPPAPQLYFQGSLVHCPPIALQGYQNSPTHQPPLAGPSLDSGLDLLLDRGGLSAHYRNVQGSSTQPPPDLLQENQGSLSQQQTLARLLPHFPLDPFLDSEGLPAHSEATPFTPYPTGPSQQSEDQPTQYQAIQESAPYYTSQPSQDYLDPRPHD